MKLTPKMVLEIAHHEAVIRQAYKDSVGVWTWSVGITSASGHDVERYIDKPQTMRKCLEVYIWLLEQKYAPAVDKAFQGVTLTEAQYTAALSFHWNTGAIGRASWVKRFKGGDVAGARSAFMAWNKPAEIIGRREAERDLFFDGKWSGNGMIGEYTRLTPRYAPVWPSRVNVDVRADVGAILGGRPAAVDAAPAPSAVETPQSVTWADAWARFIALFAKKG
jgi:lysozyme